MSFLYTYTWKNDIQRSVRRGNVTNVWKIETKYVAKISFEIILRHLTRRVHVFSVFFFVFWIGSYVSLTKLNTTGVQWHIYRIKFGVDARCTIMSTLIKLIVEIHMKFFDISHMKWWIDNNGWCLSCYINTMAVFGVLRQNVCQTCESTDCKNQQRKNCGCWSRNKPK